MTICSSVEDLESGDLYFYDYYGLMPHKVSMKNCLTLPEQSKVTYLCDVNTEFKPVKVV